MRVAVLTVFASAAVVAAQAPADVQQWFESGQHQRVVDGASASADPRVRYLVGLSYTELDRDGDARGVFETLAARPDTDPWSHIGRSAAALAGGAAEGDPVVTAEQAARRAIELDPGLSLGHYQLGLVHGRRRDYAQAAAALERVIQAEPGFAYAHYRAGLSYYQIDRTDKMAEAFEYFLRLAPDAPERGQVESIMRTLRGR